MEKDKQNESIEKLECVKDKVKDKVLAGKIAEKIKHVKQPLNK